MNVVSVMGANPFQKMWKIQFPSALPFIMAGLRVSVPSCMIGAIVGEFISSNRGVGFMIIDAQSEWEHSGRFRRDFHHFPYGALHERSCEFHGAQISALASPGKR